MLSGKNITLITQILQSLTTQNASCVKTKTILQILNLTGQFVNFWLNIYINFNNQKQQGILKEKSIQVGLLSLMPVNLLFNTPQKITIN